MDSKPSGYQYEFESLRQCKKAHPQKRAVMRHIKTIFGFPQKSALFLIQSILPSWLIYFTHMNNDYVHGQYDFVVCDDDLPLYLTPGFYCIHIRSKIATSPSNLARRTLILQFDCRLQQSSSVSGVEKVQQITTLSIYLLGICTDGVILLENNCQKKIGIHPDHLRNYMFFGCPSNILSREVLCEYFIERCSSTT